MQTGKIQVTSGLHSKGLVFSQLRTVVLHPIALTFAECGFGPEMEITLIDSSKIEMGTT